ncbi:MAG: hypothetical protein K6F88_08400, partial [Ruminococcus sp.]|nr:hypothetical protein [Ruminococcus sp.]
MIDLLLAIFEVLTQNGISTLLAISGIIILISIVLGVRHYGKNYINRLFHKRNLCWFLCWLISLAVMFIFCNFHILTRCPIFLSITLVVVYAFFTFSVFASVSRLVFFPKWYIKKYKKLKSRGYVVENKDVVKHRPWYFLDANERIEYELLKASYLKDLGNIKFAYETLSNAKKLPMYKDEVSECDISRVYLLIELGNIKKARQVLESVKKYDYTAYCFLDSFISEMEGKLDEAFEKAQKAENSINDGKYESTRIKQALYNHLGRLYCFKNNPTEVFRYFRLSIEEAKKLKETSMLDITYNNLIEQYMINNRPREEIIGLFDEYKKQLDFNNLNTVCQLINLRTRIARHFNDKTDEEAVIRQGYETLKQKSKYPELAIQRVQIMHMLQMGSFNLEPVISDIESDLSTYLDLPLPQKPRVFIALAQFAERPDVDRVRFSEIKKIVFRYLSQSAILDLDTYYAGLSSNCVNERCETLANKVDAYVMLDINAKLQYQLLHDIKQIYHDNDMNLSEAQSNLNIIKYYAQQVDKRVQLTAENISEINELLKEALQISYNIPWPLLGNLLVDIASASEFFNNPAMVRSILGRFNSLGLTKDNCDD